MSDTPNDKWEPCGPCGGLGRMMRMEDRALVTCGYCDGAMRRSVIEKEAGHWKSAWQKCHLSRSKSEQELSERDEQLMRWFKAASPYATPGSLESALARFHVWQDRLNEVLKPNAAPQAATGTVPPESSAPADAALTCLCLSFPKACPVHRGGPIDSTVKPSAWD